MIAVRKEEEIALLREANRIVVAVHEALAPMIVPGARTRELDKTAETIVRDHGATPSFLGFHGFPASTCISIDDQVVHGIPGDRELRDGEIVSVDVGACYQGYHGDAAVTHPCGIISEEKQRLLDVTNLALSRAVRSAKRGNYLRDIGKAVESTCNEAGFGVVRNFVGHGIGTSMHEEPQIPNFVTRHRGPKLQDRMVLAIEPMVNAGTPRVRVLDDGWTAVTEDGRPSAHFEHSVVVRKDGGEILSWSEAIGWGKVQEDEVIN